MSVIVGEWEGIPRHQVLQVLEAHGVEVLPRADEPGMFVLLKGDVHKAIPLPVHVKRRLLRALSRDFEVPLLHLFNPDRAHGPTN